MRTGAYRVGLCSLEKQISHCGAALALPTVDGVDEFRSTVVEGRIQEAVVVEGCVFGALLAELGQRGWWLGDFPLGEETFEVLLGDLGSDVEVVERPFAGCGGGFGGFAG
ncbi:hypothetical protein BSZ39_05305 [Bowdeniella nasicola]|uniref:Uncharacterized protein n=1 Tax=Bowdeniella nasicola TaxID=208480 RepID=A0A1Q5Q357_9ACTO|nr:hypothetical protein BSZ39_05305 [Bowdeniella nasicola]